MYTLTLGNGRDEVPFWAVNCNAAASRGNRQLPTSERSRLKTGHVKSILRIVSVIG